MPWWVWLLIALGAFSLGMVVMIIIVIRGIGTLFGPES